MSSIENLEAGKYLESLDRKIKVQREYRDINEFYRVITKEENKVFYSLDDLSRFLLKEYGNIQFKQKSIVSVCQENFRTYEKDFL